MCPISDLCRVTSALSHQCYLSYQAHKFSFFCSSYCGIMCFRTLSLVFYLMLYQVFCLVLSLMLAVHCPVLPLVLSLMLYPEFSLVLSFVLATKLKSALSIGPFSAIFWLRLVLSLVLSLILTNLRCFLNARSCALFGNVPDALFALSGALSCSYFWFSIFFPFTAMFASCAKNLKH